VDAFVEKLSDFDVRKLKKNRWRVARYKGSGKVVKQVWNVSKFRGYLQITEFNGELFLKPS